MLMPAHFRGGNMKSASLLATVPAALLLGLSVTPALAQRQAPPTPEQRIERLERQMQQVQRQVFPRGRPAETAGYSDEPAATQASVLSLDQRLAALERQLADTLRQAEENGFKMRTMEAELQRVKSDQESRIAALERTAQATQVAAAEPTAAGPGEKPTAEVTVATSAPKPTAAIASSSSADEPETDPGEIAYDEGYQLWKSGRYDQAITSLRATASSFPDHRRASWARNLAGRALLDKGEARAAAEALLANYRKDPKGERAADSLFYLGQSLMKLGQPGQACKAYAELEGVYGDRMRGELKTLLPKAKSEARCS